MSDLQITLLGSAALVSGSVLAGAGIVAFGVSRALGRLTHAVVHFQMYLEITIHEFARQQTEARDAPPAIPPAAQDEGQAVQVGAGSADPAVRDGVTVVSADAEQFVATAGAGEAEPHARDPAPASDALIRREAA